MTDTNPAPPETRLEARLDRWTRKQAILLAALCLMAGIAGGWLIRASQRPAVSKSAKIVGPAAMETASASAAPTPARLKEMADAQVAPLLDKLKADPGNPDLLAGVGNVYYDAQQYPIAIDYYTHALQARPADAGVRTDLGTALWFVGKPDEAIREFDRALADAPNNPNTLFNRGLVKWKGKKDGAGALADWEKLLATNPKYDGKDKVEQLIAEVKMNSAVGPGLKAK